MKTSFTLSLLAMVLSISLLAQKTWVGFSSDDAQLPEITLQEQTVDQVVLSVDISGMYVTELNQDDQNFQRLELIPNQTTKEVGRPELPMLNELIGIPGNRIASVEVISMQTVKLEGYHIYPFQTPTTDQYIVFHFC